MSPAQRSDPRCFGVAELGGNGSVKRFMEKPKEMDYHAVIVRCFYLKTSEVLLTTMDKQMRQNMQLKSEFFLADAIQWMVGDNRDIFLA